MFLNETSISLVSVTELKLVQFVYEPNHSGKKKRESFKKYAPIYASTNRFSFVLNKKKIFCVFCFFLNEFDLAG